MPKLKIHIVLGFLLAGLIVILTGQYTLNIFAVKKPLRDAITEVKGVSTMRMDEGTPVPTIEINLKDNADLPASYDTVREIALQRIGERAKVIIANPGTKDLRSKWDDIHYYVEEAASRGTFAEMKHALDRYVSESDSSIRSWVGDDNIYVEIASKGHYLYKVVPRRDTRVMGNIEKNA